MTIHNSFPTPSELDDPTLTGILGRLVDIIEEDVDPTPRDRIMDVIHEIHCRFSSVMLRNAELMRDIEKERERTSAHNRNIVRILCISQFTLIVLVFFMLIIATTLFAQ